MFAILLRWGHRTPGPRVDWPMDGVLMVFIAVLIVAFVHGWGAAFVALCFAAHGVARLVTLPQSSSATARTDADPVAPSPRS